MIKDARGDKNPNWKGGMIKKKCLICKTEFLVYPSGKKKSCSWNCASKLKSINSKCTNLGKTKHDTPHLMKMSLERTGKVRSEQIKKHIREGTLAAISIDKNRKKFLKGNKNRDMSFMKDPKWIEKRNKTRMKNIYKTNKYVFNSIRMRSNWEVKYAKYLTDNNIKFKYEPKTFYLKSIKKHYTPDFYLPMYNKYVEIKGWLTKESVEKIEAFKKDYNLNFELICGKQMFELNLIKKI